MKALRHTLAFILSFLVSSVSAQRETMDLASFIPPAGWQRTNVDHGVDFLRVNETQTEYARLFLYKSRKLSQANGEAQLVFDWNDLIKSQINVDVPEVKQFPMASGWVLYSAEKLVKTDHEFMKSLLSYTGHGVVITLIVTYNGSTWQKDLDAFFSNLQIFPPQAATTQPAVQSATTQPDAKNQTSTKPTAMPTDKKVCLSCAGGYNNCGSCFGSGQKSQTVYESQYDSYSKTYVSRPVSRYVSCMSCAGSGRTRCSYCGGRGYN